MEIDLSSALASISNAEGRRVAKGVEVLASVVVEQLFKTAVHEIGLLEIVGGVFRPHEIEGDGIREHVFQRKNCLGRRGHDSRVDIPAKTIALIIAAVDDRAPETSEQRLDARSSLDDGRIIESSIMVSAAIIDWLAD